VLILECSQGCYGRKDGSVTISLRNFVGEGMINMINQVGKKRQIRELLVKKSGETMFFKFFFTLNGNNLS
jgi:hypothetical protein